MRKSRIALAVAIAAAVGLCVAIVLHTVEFLPLNTLHGSGMISEEIRLEFQEPLEQALTLHVRGIRVVGPLSRLGEHFMTLNIHDDTDRGQWEWVYDPEIMLHYGRISISTDSNTQAHIRVDFDEDAGKIVIEPTQPDMHFSPNTLSVRVNLPIDNLIVEDGAWAIWRMGDLGSSVVRHFSAQLYDINRSEFSFRDEQLEFLHITHNSNAILSIEGTADRVELINNGNGTINFRDRW